MQLDSIVISADRVHIPGGKKMKLGDCGVISCIATKNKERAREFYENVLGLRFVKDDSFALVFDSNGTELRISKVPEFVAIPYSVLGWTVPDIARATTELQQA